MGQRTQIIRLAETTDRTVRFLSGIHVQLDEGVTRSWVTITRTGTFTDPRYGKFNQTREMLLAMVANFEANAYGQDIFIDVAHKPENGAAAKFVKLAVEGDRLRGLVEWTPYGLDAVKNKGYKYLSAEYHPNFTDNETGKAHGCVLLAAGLTTRPVVKRLDPIQLAESDAGSEGPAILLHPTLLSELLSEVKTIMNEHLKKLEEQLRAMKLSEAAIASYLNAAKQAMTGMTDDAAMKSLCEAMLDGAKKLSEGQAPQITINSSSITAEDVKRLLSEHQAAQDSAAKKLADALDANKKALADAINAAQGLDADTKAKLLTEGAAMITATMTTEDAKKLAEFQIGMANQVAAAKKLSEIGFQYGPTGAVRLSMPDEGSIKIQKIYHDHLKLTAPFGGGQLKLAEKVHPFVGKVLAEFDRIHAQDIHNEVKMLAGETGMANTSLPIGFVREVIREALSDLNILQLIQANIDPSATATTQIPYELRDISQVVNDGIVYEGQPIPNAGISQLMDTAYITPMKLALKISNEVIHFTRASGINWDALARNLESNARVMRELIARRIANELQRSSDAYGAVAVVGETFDSQLTGSAHTIKTAYFPIVRPHQERDLRGNAVGNAECAIAIVLNGTTLTPWDGTGTQETGTYYRVLNYNLGYIQFVDKAGTPVTPTDTGTNTIGYSKATNLVKVDLDVASGLTYEQQLNKAIQAVGARKAMLSGQRFVQPDFLLMSPTLNDTLTNAEQFVAERKRDGSDTTPDGDLQKIKGIPSYGTNAPGINLGDERVLMGVRGQLGYTVSKPFAIGELFEAVDPTTAQPIGKKMAYGEEYNAIKMPTPVRNRFTSVLVYSVSGR